MTDLEPTCLSWPEKIAQLKKSTEEARSHRQKLAKELKSAQRKNKRLKERARFLSEEDMVQILVLKRQKTAAAKEESASSSSSSSKGDKTHKSRQGTVRRRPPLALKRKMRQTSLTAAIFSLRVVCHGPRVG